MNLCLCCESAKATDFDPHIGDVCTPCAHHLEHVGLMLANCPILQMRHPVPLNSPTIQFPRFNQKSKTR